MLGRVEALVTDAGSEAERMGSAATGLGLWRRDALGASSSSEPLTSVPHGEDMCESDESLLCGFPGKTQNCLSPRNALGLTPRNPSCMSPGACVPLPGACEPQHQLRMPCTKLPGLRSTTSFRGPRDRYSRCAKQAEKQTTKDTLRRDRALAEQGQAQRQPHTTNPKKTLH